MSGALGSFFRCFASLLSFNSYIFLPSPPLLLLRCSLSLSLSLLSRLSKRSKEDVEDDDDDDDDSDDDRHAFSATLNGRSSYLEMSAMGDDGFRDGRKSSLHLHRPKQVDPTAGVSDTWLKSKLNNVDKNAENMFDVVAAALEKHRVATGLEELRLEVSETRQ